jgi:nitrogen regulatory protein P-II 1
VGVGFTTIFNQFVVFFVNPFRSKNVRSIVPKTKIEIIIPNYLEDMVVDTIMAAAHTGSIGDGKIFVTPVEEAIRIRTGERGEEAI